MKTANSIDDKLLRKRPKQMLAQLNKIFAVAAQPDEQRLLRGMKARVRSTVKDRW